jgi:SPP1 gp7 family putative phage head morphogenesis protein
MPSRKWDDLDRAVRKALDGILNRAEKQLILTYAQGLKEIRQKMADLYEKASGPDGKLTYAEMTKYNRYKTLEKNITDIMHDRWRLTFADIDKLQSELYNESFFRYAWAFDQNTGISLSWGPIDEDSLRAIIDNPLKLIAKDTLDTATRNKIRGAITSGLLQGKSYPQMMKDIRAAMDNLVYQAMRIARTEGQRAMSEGTLSAYGRALENGMNGDIVWDATLDSRTRPHHQEMDGQKRAEDGFFTLPGGARTAGPLMSGIASEDINCRCTTRFQITGYEPILRRTRDGGLINYTTYPEWQKNLNSNGIYRQK